MHPHDEEDYQSLLPKVEKLTGKKAVLLLGTDEHIGEGLDAQPERRVGITPRQIAYLKKWLQEAGVYLDFYFLQGAGIQAGYTDGDYNNVGGQLMYEHQLPNMPAPHIVHALKEPCSYESLIQGPFIRIGALHPGAFDTTSGLATLFKRKNFCAIFDGSNIGGYAYRLNKGYRVPIRSSMSVFAGQIGADKVGERFSGDETKRKVVISGGGVVGSSAVNSLLQHHPALCESINVVEENPGRCVELREQYKDSPSVKIVESGRVGRDVLDGADALMLTAFRPGEQAPKVIDLPELSAMNDGSIIVDIAIDEKSGIQVQGIDYDAAPLPDVIAQTTSAIGRLRKNILYVADSHLPRMMPKEASKAHGKAVLPYIATLLYLSSREGGAPQAVKYITDAQIKDDNSDYFEALVYDLKNGLACRRPDPIFLNEKIIKGVVKNIQDFLELEGIPNHVE